MAPLKDVKKKARTVVLADIEQSISFPVPVAAIKSSKTVRRTHTMRKVVVDILKEIHDRFLQTLDDFNENKAIENLVLEAAIKYGLVSQNENFTESDKLNRLNALIKNNLDSMQYLLSQHTDLMRGHVGSLQNVKHMLDEFDLDSTNTNHKIQHASL